MPKQSTLERLGPVGDRDGLLRVGVRISEADLSEEEKHPLIMPHAHHISTVLLRHFHQQVVRQGRHVTEGTVGAAGYWIIGSKRPSSIVSKCVTCRKL